MSWANLYNDNFLTQIIEQGFSVIIDDFYPVGSFVFGTVDGKEPFCELDGWETRRWERVEGVLVSSSAWEVGPIPGMMFTIPQNNDDAVPEGDMKVNVLNVPLFMRTA